MNLSPREIVQELDRYIIGQNSAKKAVAIALRNRYRRSKLTPELRDEITPKNMRLRKRTLDTETRLKRKAKGLE